MRLAHLSLSTFRNYGALDLPFTPGHQLFLGQNGEGKTNILEAIHLLGTGSSMRASRDTQLVQHGERGFRIGARLEDVEDEARPTLRIEIVLEPGRGKRVMLEKEPARASDLIAAIKVVSFAPSDVELIQGSGSVRRRYLDLIGCQLSAEYLADLREYQRAVNQRNETLKKSFAYTHGKHAAAEARAPWTDLVVEIGAKLFLRRRILVEQVTEALESITADAYRGAGPLQAAYLPGVKWEGDDARDALAAALEASRDKDEALGYTTAGPHTDDLRLELAERALRQYGSLGQQQLSAMFLKLAQADLVRTTVGAAPLLLVDEMFAILDRRAAEEFLARIEGEGQIFLATAQEGWLGELRARRFHVHEVCAGTVASETQAPKPA